MPNTRSGFIGALARRMRFWTRDRPRRGIVRPSAAPPMESLIQMYGAAQMRNNEGICAAVTRLSNALACMPVHLYRDYRIQADHPLEKLIAFAPNANLSPFGFRYPFLEPAVEMKEQEILDAIMGELTKGLGKG